jgi:hypothetical protein
MASRTASATGYGRSPFPDLGHHSPRESNRRFSGAALAATGLEELDQDSGPPWEAGQVDRAGDRDRDDGRVGRNLGKPACAAEGSDGVAAGEFALREDPDAGTRGQRQRDASEFSPVSATTRDRKLIHSTQNPGQWLAAPQFSFGDRSDLRASTGRDTDDKRVPVGVMIGQ